MDDTTLPRHPTTRHRPWPAVWLAAAGLLAAPAALAATITVTSTASNQIPGDGACTLAEAVANANAGLDRTQGDCVAGTAGGNTLVLGERQVYRLGGPMTGDSGEDAESGLTTVGDLVVEGRGSTIQLDDSLAGQSLRVVHTLSGTQVWRDVTLRNGHLINAAGDGTGAGLWVRAAATVTLERVAVRDNTAVATGEAVAGIAAEGPMHIVDSTIANNAAAYHPASGDPRQKVGGLRLGSASSASSVELLRSTVTGNRVETIPLGEEAMSTAAIASYYGPDRPAASSILTIDQSTIVGNDGGAGGVGGISLATTTLKRSILSGNTGLRSDSASFCIRAGLARATGRITSGGYNIVGSNGRFALENLNNPAIFSCVANNVLTPTDRIPPAGVTADMIVAALADNGGPTPTQAPLAGGLAVDAIPATATDTSGSPFCDPAGSDQRGAPRGQDGNGNGSTACDIGAVERQRTDLDLGFSLGGPTLIGDSNSGVVAFLSFNNLGPGTSVGGRFRLTWNSPLRAEGFSPACTITPTSVECPTGLYAPNQPILIQPALFPPATSQDVQIDLAAEWLPLGADTDPDPATGRATATLLVLAPDSTPDAFDFGSRAAVARSTLLEAGPITVSGINIRAPISVAGGEYRVYRRVGFTEENNPNPVGCAFNAAWTREPGLVLAGDKVCVRHTSSAQFAADTVTTLTIGGVTGTFTSTTLARDITPDAFSFAPVIDVPRSTLQTSNAVTIAGINDAAPYSVLNGFAAVNGGACTASSGTVSAGDTLRVCHVSSASYASTVTTTLTVGADGVLAGVSADYRSTTIGPPVLAVSPAALSFGGQRVGTTSAAQAVTLRNAGASPLTLGSVQASAGFVASSACPAQLAPRQECAVQLRFAPGASGAISGTLAIASDGGAQTVTLAGTGIAPMIRLAPDALAFGGQRIGTTSTAQSVTVSNPGSDVLAIASVSVSGPFLRDGGSCTSSLAAGGSCTIALRFAPTVAGTATGTLSVQSDAGSVSASLGGSGLTATLAVAPAALDFGPRAVLVSTLPKTVTVSNTGTDRIALGTPAIGGANAGDFTISGNSCGSTLAAGANCSIAIVFKPGYTGARAATLSVPSDARNGTQAVALKGTGTGICLRVGTDAQGNKVCVGLGLGN